MCIWRNDDSTTWETECGKAFCLNDGTPYENEMRFCCFCGEALAEEFAMREKEDDTD